MNRTPSLYRKPLDPGGFPFGYNWRATLGGLALLALFNFAASQYIAARFHYQPALGTPLFRTHSVAVYQPFAWCQWGYRYCATPDVRIRNPMFEGEFASEDDIASRQVMSIGEFRAKIAALQPSNRFPVLIFDQFEEFVSLFEEALHGEAFQAARRVQTDLLDLMVSLYRDSDLHVKLIFVFREDYLAKLGKLFNRCPDLRDVFLHIAAPRTAALEQIILGPFRRFPGRFSYEFPETLAKRLQFAFEERSDSSELNLSEVQIACQRLWRSVDQEQEFARKGLRGLLEDYFGGFAQAPTG